jgi:hypothetical protein
MGPPGFQLFELVFQLIAVFIAVFALAMAAFPRRMTRWQMRGPDGTTQIEPSRMRLLMTRLMGFFVAAIAVLMAFGSRVILP